MRNRNRSAIMMYGNEHVISEGSIVNGIDHWKQVNSTFLPPIVVVEFLDLLKKKNYKSYPKRRQKLFTSQRRLSKSDERRTSSIILRIEFASSFPLVLRFFSLNSRGSSCRIFARCSIKFSIIAIPWVVPIVKIN